MENQNPFMPGDRVVCINDNWVGGVKSKDPKKGEVLTVSKTVSAYVIFDKYDTDIYQNEYHYSGFAPAKDATDMEFEETEYAHYEEMTA